MNMTEQEQRMIMRRVNKAIGCIQEGQDAMDVLGRIYCENLPDKSSRQGRLMAEAVRQWIGIFQNEYDQALDAPEARLEERLEAALAHLPPEQRQTEKDRFYQAMDVQTDLFALDADAFNRRNEVKWAVGDEMALAVTAMVLYTMSKNGELSGLPSETTLAEVTLNVCAENKYREIEFAQQQDYISEETAGQRRKTLWAAWGQGIILASGLILWGLSKFPTLAGTAGMIAASLIWVAGAAGFYYCVFAELSRDEDLPHMSVLDAVEQTTEVTSPAAPKLPAEVLRDAASQSETETQPQRNKQ